jgi:hypothetical protein
MLSVIVNEFGRVGMARHPIRPARVNTRPSVVMITSQPLAAVASAWTRASVNGPGCAIVSIIIIPPCARDILSAPRTCVTLRRGANREAFPYLRPRGPNQGMKSTKNGCHRLAFRMVCNFLISAVRPEGACHQWRRVPPRELSIALVADERFGWVTGWIEAS